jgi:hypothetical protein
MVKRKQKTNLKGLVVVVLALLLAGLTGAVININIEPTTDEYTAEIEYSEEQVPAALTDDMGEVVETTEFEGQEIPTVEEVDGGLFEDETTGVSVTEGEYEDLGWAETYNVSSPEAFKNDTMGKCIRANNRYGSQCVSLARVFWWSYANRDVSTCGTGMAKGMMDCWQQNAGSDFVAFWGNSNIQAGDWLVFSGGQYGHVGMALGPVRNGYVALLGENQGGRACEGGGAATNIINMSIKTLIGGYRPKAYIAPEPAPKPEPKPTPAPAPVVDKCKVRKVVKGDTMGKIMKECEGKITWGQAMNDYASHWYSTTFKKYLTVYDGWNSRNGVGLFSGDTIEFRK